MLRLGALAIFVAASGCAYDYDAAFAGAVSSAGGASSVGGAGGETSAGGAATVASTIGAGGAGGREATTTDASASTGLPPCVCAPPGACDANNVCMCPASVTIERLPTIGEGTNAGNKGWSNVGFITVPDANAASVILGNGQSSEQLTARGFDFNEIPNDATLTGIHVDIDRCRTVEASPVDVVDTWLRMSSGGAAVGAGVPAQTWGACGSGGGGYEFPVTGIAPVTLKSDFGIQLRIKNQATGSATGYVNYVKATVTFKPTCAP